jgi:hypothetical protein
MSRINPARDRFHAVERYRSWWRAARRVAELNGAHYHAYLVVGRTVVVHVSNGKRLDLRRLPRRR